jgi:integrase
MPRKSTARSSARFWVEPLKSGRYRARIRSGSGSTTSSPPFDYEYEAEEWLTAAMARAENARLAATEPAPAPAAPPADTGAAAILEALRSAGIVLPGSTPDSAPDSTPATSAPTVREYADRFLAARRGHLSAGTLSGYETHLRLGVGSSELAETPLDRIDRESVDGWLGGMVEDEVGRPTINARLKTFRTMLSYAIENRVIDHDPTARIKFLPLDVRDFRGVDAGEEARLLAACKTPEERAQVLLALDAGLRWGEVAGFPVSAIRGDYLSVWQVIDRHTRKVRGYPKGKRGRTVPIPTTRLREALALVAVTAEVRGPDALLFGRISKGVERPIDPRNWARDFWHRATDAAGLNPGGDRLHFHDLRHTYGTRLADKGVPRAEIAKLMGHASESTTAIYIHAGTDGRRLDLSTAALAQFDHAG